MRSTLDEIVAEGARRLLAAALEVEVDACITARANERDEHGRRLVVRNGHAQGRQVVTGTGAIPVRARWSMTAGSMPTRANGSGSGPRS